MIRLGQMQILLDAVPDTRSGRLHGVPVEMSVPACGLRLGMAQQLADHRQPFAERQRADTKEWRKSWIRTWLRPARARMRRQGC